MNVSQPLPRENEVLVLTRDFGAISQLQKALEKATAQTMKLGREGDGLQHRCGSDFDWHCQGCYQHAQHLYKPRNNELHEEVGSYISLSFLLIDDAGS